MIMLLFGFTLITSATVFATRIRPPRHAVILPHQDEVQDNYDYIIVGGGASGLTVADRLTEDSNSMRDQIRFQTLTT